MILVVGQLRIADDDGHPAVLRQGYRFACLGEIDSAFLNALRPDMVISALVGEGFDALDVARCLDRLGYPGPYRVLCPPLPNPGLVRAEVRAAAPRLDFDLLVVSHDPDRPA